MSWINLGQDVVNLVGFEEQVSHDMGFLFFVFDLFHVSYLCSFFADECWACGHQ